MTFGTDTTIAPPPRRNDGVVEIDQSFAGGRANRSVFLFRLGEFVVVEETVAVLIEFGELRSGTALAGKKLVLGEFPVVVGVELLELVRR